jgi:hypothetical protein
MTIQEAVDLCYAAKINMVKAAKEAEVDVSVLKRLLAEKVKRTPIQLDQQLILPL